MIGAREVTPELLQTMPLPVPEGEADKESRGRVLVVGGEAELPGAPMLAGVAALRAGAGRLQFACPRSIAPLIGVAVPEAMAAALPEEQGCIAHEAVERICAMSKRVDALLLGPGMMQPDATRRVVTASLEAYEGDAAVVLDAGALVCPKDPRTLVRSLGGRVVLTPHPGEMARLLDRPRETVQSAAARLCRETAEAFNAVIALKGACTYIATPEGELFEHAQGCVGLATSGSGDTLSGIIAGLLARGASPAQATIWSVYLHGAAGRRLEKRHGLLGFLARELLDEIPAIMNGLGQSSRG